MSKTTEISLLGFKMKVGKATHYKLGDGIRLEFGQAYSFPELSFDWMSQLSKHFGTTDIDIDHYSQGGCETCDYGSQYGYELQIYNIKKNNPFHNEVKLPKDEYLDVCPNCFSKDLSADSLDVDGGQAWRDAYCQVCDFAWREVFEFQFNEEAN